MFNVVVYHEHCNDGVMALYEVCSTCKPDYIIPCKAGFSPELDHIKNKQNLIILFVDLCPTTLSDELRSFKKIIICDHHKSEIDKLLTLELPSNLELVYNPDKAGCQIISNYIYGGQQRNWLIDYIADRDLWKFDLPHSREINLSIYKTGFIHGIQLHLLNFKECPDISSETFEKHLELGKILWDVQQKEIEIIARAASFKNITIKGKKYTIWVILTDHLTSEVGEYLYNKKFKWGAIPDFVALPSFDMRTKLWKISLRAHKDNPIDVSVIASSFPGGGGHKSAAGFSITHDNFLKLFC